MDSGLLDTLDCTDSVGILHIWLSPAGTNACLSPLLSLLQLAVILAGIILAKHLIVRRISSARAARIDPAGRKDALPGARPGWIDGKPAIYTKIPRR